MNDEIIPHCRSATISGAATRGVRLGSHAHEGAEFHRSSIAQELLDDADLSHNGGSGRAAEEALQACQQTNDTAYTPLPTLPRPPPYPSPARGGGKGGGSGRVGGGGRSGRAECGDALGKVGNA